MSLTGAISNTSWGEFVKSGRSVIINDPSRYYTPGSMPHNAPNKIVIKTNGNAVELEIDFPYTTYGPGNLSRDVVEGYYRQGMEVDFQATRGDSSSVRSLKITTSLENMRTYLNNQTVAGELPTAKILQEINQLNQSIATDVRSV